MTVPDEVWAALPDWVDRAAIERELNDGAPSFAGIPADFCLAVSYQVVDGVPVRKRCRRRHGWTDDWSQHEWVVVE